jgi:predicted amidohydrolase YtcJ
MNLLEKHLPQDDDNILLDRLNIAGKHLLSLGITSMHDAGIDHNVYHFYKEMAEKQALPIRIYAMIAATDPLLELMLNKGYVTDQYDFLSIRSVKAYGDGALGSRGAAMIEAYSDEPSNTGLLLTRKADIKPLFDLVLSKGFQLNFHAIGDLGNLIALDQYADSFKRIGGELQRHRIEHAQVVAVEDIPRFNELNIIPSMQPTHATSDMNMAEQRIGEQRLKGAYAWKSFLKQGSRLAFGSDFPVELANPFFGLHAAVTRQDRQNQPVDGWIKSEALTLAEAFRAFTLDAAYAAHQEKVLGTLIPGKWADFILVDQDIFAGASQDIWKTQILETWIGGVKRFEKEH